MFSSTSDRGFLLEAFHQTLHPHIETYKAPVGALAGVGPLPLRAPLNQGPAPNLNPHIGQVRWTWPLAGQHMQGHEDYGGTTARTTVTSTT